MNSWIALSVPNIAIIQFFIEKIHSIDEKEKNIIFTADKITLYRMDRWLIELHMPVILYKWDYFFLNCQWKSESIICWIDISYLHILSLMNLNKRGHGLKKNIADSGECSMRCINIKS